MTKAFAYLRTSSHTSDPGDSFPRQLAAIQAYAAAHEIEIVEVFEERGVSGTKELASRPALQLLLGAFNGVRLVLVEKLDRLARDLMVQETLLAELKKYQVELISVMEPDLCSNDPSRKLIRQIMGAIAEYERTIIVMKLRGARQRARLKRPDYKEGRVPFGYKVVSQDGHPVRVEDEAEQRALKAMRELSQTATLAQIAGFLQASGYKPRKGQIWHPKTISRILERVA